MSPDHPSAPRRVWTWAIGAVIATALLAAVSMTHVLLRPSSVLDFNDGNIESALAPAYRCPAAMLRVWDNQFFFGQGGQQFAISSASVGESLAGPHHYRREFVVVLLALVAGAIYWALRQLGFSPLASALAGVVTALSGSCFSFAVLGLTVRAAGLGFAALAVGFLERGIQDRAILPYALAGGCLGMAIAEVPDIGVFFALTIAAIFLTRHWPERPNVREWVGLAGRGLALVAASFLLAWQTVHVMFRTQIAGVQSGTADDPAERYNWATQWSLPPNETWTLVSGTYFGLSMRSDTAPYWGRIGRSPGWETHRRGFRNFSLTGHYLGLIPVAWILAGWWGLRNHPPGRRRRWLWISWVGSLVCLVLAWGRYTPFYRLVFSLPYLGTIRNPEKWWMPGLLCALPAMAEGIEQIVFRTTELVRTGSRSSLFKDAFAIACIALGVLGLILLLDLLSGRESFVATRMNEEFSAEQAQAAWRTAVASSLSVVLLSGLAVGGLRWIHRRPWADPTRAGRWAIAWLTALAWVQLGLVNRRYASGREYRHVLDPNPLTEFIAQHRSEGRFKLLPPEHPGLQSVFNLLRMSYLQVSGCDLFDPVSVSRLPSDYAAFFQSMRDQIRVWSLGAIRFFVTVPGAAEQLNRMDGNRGRFREVLSLGLVQRGNVIVPNSAVPTEQQIVRIVAFEGARPRVFVPRRITSVPATPDGQLQTFDRLTAPNFNPLEEAVVSGAEPATAEYAGEHEVRIVQDEPAAMKAEVRLSADGWLLRATKYDPDWVVRIDGCPATLHVADALFQAVRVPAGTHQVEWEYRPSRGPFYVALAGRGMWLLAWLIWLLRRRTNPSEIPS
jgi:hypothetical protein